MPNSSIIDISPALNESTAVFPGDQKFTRSVSMAFEKGHHLGLSAISSTVHVGAHADAPNHYHKDGVGIDKVDLRRYMGPVQVFHLKGLGKAARIDLKTCFGSNLENPIRKIVAKRILFRTDSFSNPFHWHDDFNSLSPELIHFLAQQGVVLVGIDTPSVDPATSKKLESHQALWETNVSVLEGLDLRQVPEGNYGIMALPLAIEGGDASPVRAVLVDHAFAVPELL